MRGRIIVLIALLVMAAVESEAANAQLSPGGVFGAVARPFRQMLGHVRYRWNHHRGAVQLNGGAALQTSPTAQAPSQLGLVGPLAWPSAYEDVLGYTFWPSDYGANFRAHGFDVVSNTIAGRFDLQTLRAPVSPQTATNGAAVANTSAAEICDDRSETQDDWPMARIEQSAQLTDAQRNALGELRAAFADAVKTIKAGCRDVTSLPPTDRLKVMVQQLWTVRDAGIFVRAQLKTFYDSLTDDQKASFAFKPPQDDPRQAGNNTNSGMAQQYKACASQIAMDSERLVRQIEQNVRPNKGQRASLQALRKTSSDMAKLLSASCAQPIPVDPLERLDAANNQLSSMNYAATNVEIALNGLYAKLDRRQKEKLAALRR
jgi:hypothetical protein